MKSGDLSLEMVETCLMHYAKKYIPGISRTNRKPSSSSSGVAADNSHWSLSLPNRRLGWALLHRQFLRQRCRPSSREGDSAAPRDRSAEDREEGFGSEIGLWARVAATAHCSPTLLGYSAQGVCKFGFYEFFKKYYSDLAGPDFAAKYKTLIYLAGSASAEFSGFLLYKELGRRLKKTNPVVAEIFSRFVSAIKSLLAVIQEDALESDFFTIWFI